ncbi:MAG: hypothetical protein ACRD1R_18340 [Acidobacteriota bacterium]
MPLLTLSLTLLLVSMIAVSAPLFAVSIVSTIVSLTSLGSPSRLLMLALWLWLNLVLSIIFLQPASEILLFGLSLPAFWMLFGIWIVPVLIWPLGFLLDFKSWMRK